MTRECENMSGGETADGRDLAARCSAPRASSSSTSRARGWRPKIVQDVMRTIRRLKAEGVACLIVEQNALAALEVADRVYVMDRGRIVHEGPARELLDERRAPPRARRDLTHGQAAAPMLEVERLEKVYTARLRPHRPTFRLTADFRVEEPGIVGMMGPNGSGKTTLFELITGSNAPTAGEVSVLGRDIHRVRTVQRDRLAIHYHQSYQVRHFRSPDARTLPDAARRHVTTRIVHLFDEPQFNTQDGYIGFMLDFFRRLRDEGRLVFLCVHPNERFHLEIVEEICERFVFVRNGADHRGRGLRRRCSRICRPAPISATCSERAHA